MTAPLTRYVSGASAITCSHRVAIETLFNDHGVDGLAAVQQQQDTSALSGSSVAAALHDVGQLLALSFRQNKGAGFARHGHIVCASVSKYQSIYWGALTYFKDVLTLLPTQKSNQIDEFLLHNWHLTKP